MNTIGSLTLLIVTLTIFVLTHNFATAASRQSKYKGTERKFHTDENKTPHSKDLSPEDPKGLKIKTVKKSNIDVQQNKIKIYKDARNTKSTDSKQIKSNDEINLTARRIKRNSNSKTIRKTKSVDNISSEKSIKFDTTSKVKSTGNNVKTNNKNPEISMGTKNKKSFVVADYTNSYDHSYDIKKTKTTVANIEKDLSNKEQINKSSKNLKTIKTGTKGSETDEHYDQNDATDTETLDIDNYNQVTIMNEMNKKRRFTNKKNATALGNDEPEKSTEIEENTNDNFVEPLEDFKSKYSTNKNNVDQSAEKENKILIDDENYEENNIMIEEQDIETNGIINIHNKSTKKGPEGININKYKNGLFQDIKPKIIKKYRLIKEVKDINERETNSFDETTQEISNAELKTYLYIVHEKFKGDEIMYEVKEENGGISCGIPEIVDDCLL